MDLCGTTGFIGWICIVFVTYRLILTAYNILYPFFIAKPRDLRKIAGAKWAVITGATDGIGRGYAFELAKKGFSIMLVSRTQSRLDDVKIQLEKETGVEVRTIAFDFSSPDLEYYRRLLLPQIQELDVGILVNNVGHAFDYPDLYHKVDGGIDLFRHIDIINILPATVLMAAVLPQMYERDSGIIVNISSFASYYKLRWFGVYSASKKYLSWLTKIVQYEYANTNIVIQEVNPMVVATKLGKVRRSSFFEPSPDAYAAYAVRTIGIVKETTGYFSHQMKAELFKWLPELVVDQYLHRRMLLFHKVMVARKMRQAAAANNLNAQKNNKQSRMEN